MILVTEGFIIPRVHSNIFNLSLISNSFVFLKMNFPFATEFPKTKIIQDLVYPTNHWGISNNIKNMPQLPQTFGFDFIEFSIINLIFNNLCTMGPKT